MSNRLPAWTKESMVLRLPVLATEAEESPWSPEWAMGGATGAGVRVAVVDSGIEADHPLLGGMVDADGAIDFSVDADGTVVATPGPHTDVFGHGTACAGIIHALAPEATITSVRVLGPGLRGKAAAFHAGLQWAVEQGFDVINLSLGAGKRDWAFPFHELCDRGYFSNSFIVTAANNIQRASFPSLYASVTSVACNTSDDPLRYHFNPEPPTEFLARGIDVEVPWLNGETTVTTGNSFAAPHISGFAALIRSKHPTLRPFHVKSLLWACAANVRDATQAVEAAAAGTMSTPAAGGRGTQVIRLPTALPSTDAATLVPDSAPSPSTSPGTAHGRPVSDPTGSPQVSTPATAATAAALSIDPVAEIERELDDVHVSGLIAEGAWGAVYSARRGDGERVAIRRVERSIVGDQSLVDRFVASVRNAAVLDHPHILPIQELVVLESSLLIVMPESTSNLADLERPVPLADACIATLSLLSGLNEAHRNGLFHGDLRPRNALIDSRRHVVVSDVGLAAPLQQNARTMVRFDGGEWAYRAPEVAMGAAVGAHTDIYAVGAIAYELLAGRPPKPAPSGFAELVQAASDATPPPPLPGSIPEQIATSVMYALVHDPAYRWAKVADFSASLSYACESELGPGWAYRSRFILEPSATGAVRHSGTVARTFGTT